MLNFSTLQAIRSPARSLGGDTSGIAAIEFAMIFPIMVLMFFGMIDLSNGFAVDRKVSVVAQTMSDLTSGWQTTLKEADVTGFRNIADAILTPYDKTKMKATIHQIYLDPATKTAKIAWSRGDQKKNQNVVMTVPADLIAKDANGAWLANQYLILSEISYTYIPTIGAVVPKLGITLTEQSYMKPRQGVCITLETACSVS